MVVHPLRNCRLGKRVDGEIGDSVAKVLAPHSFLVHDHREISRGIVKPCPGFTYDAF